MNQNRAVVPPMTPAADLGQALGSGLFHSLLHVSGNIAPAFHRSGNPFQRSGKHHGSSR